MSLPDLSGLSPPDLLPSDLPVCVDARMIGGGGTLGETGTGVSTYARALLAAIVAMARPSFLLCARDEVDGRARKWLAAAFPSPASRRLHVADDGAQARLIGRDIFRRAHVHFTLHGRFIELAPPLPRGIMHWTYPVPMRMAGWINVYTVHDIIPLQRPDLSPVNQRRHRAVLRRLIDAADRIVTVSDTVRNEIAALPEWSAVRGSDQVTNCGQAVAWPSPDIGAETPLGYPAGQYFVFCGAVEPRKNLTRLILAHGRSEVRQPLLIVGPDGWRAEAINNLIRHTPNVVRIGFVERRVLLGLIAHARALLFPSLAEGFGLPIIEAMRLGTAVLTSAYGAPAEVAGGAALLIDPLDIDALATGIRSLATDDALVAALSGRGRARAEHFSLDHFAACLAAVYADAAGAYRPAPRARGA